MLNQRGGTYLPLTIVYQQIYLKEYDAYNKPFKYNLLSKTNSEKENTQKATTSQNFSRPGLEPGLTRQGGKLGSSVRHRDCTSLLLPALMRMQRPA